MAFWKTTLPNLGTCGDNQMILTNTQSLCIIPSNLRNAEAQGSVSFSLQSERGSLTHLLPVYKLASNHSSASTFLVLNAVSTQEVFFKRHLQYAAFYTDPFIERACILHHCLVETPDFVLIHANTLILVFLANITNHY